MAVGAAPGWRYRVGQVLAARRAHVTDADRGEALAELPEALQGMFLAMAPRDQAHALRVLRRVVGAEGGAEPVLRQAALLHDAGKAAAPLGTPGRSLVVLAKALRMTALLGPRARRYRQHPEIGAEMLRRAGADPVLVEVVAEHQSNTPRHPETQRLRAADRDE